MYAVAGDGTLLPVYVLYKAKHLYDTWMQNGPKGFQYNRTITVSLIGTVLMIAQRR